MSTNQTANYQLNLWEAGDDFLREEFNENFAALDAAIAAKPDVVVGTYSGNNVYPRDIELGFKPRAVLLMNRNGYAGTSNGNYGGLMLPDNGLYTASTLIAKLTDTGFQLVVKYAGSVLLNDSSHRYYYLALR